MRLTYTSAIDGTTHDVPCDDLDAVETAIPRLLKETIVAARENGCTWSVRGNGRVSWLYEQGRDIGQFELVDDD